MKGKAFIIDLGEKQVKYSQYRERAESVKQKIHFQPLIGVVLGTGLNNFAEKLSNSVSVSFLKFRIGRMQRINLIREDLYLDSTMIFLLSSAKEDSIIMKAIRARNAFVLFA